MARNTTLSALRDQLRAEIGASPNVSMGVNYVPQMNHILNRVQERLWTEYDWPFLHTEVDFQSIDGQRYYNLPNEINPDRIKKIMVSWNDYWYCCENGITEAHYNIVNSDIGDKQDEVRRWRLTDNDTKIELWPIPESDTQKLRVFAYKSFNKMVSDSDRALLDDTLIVLYAAAEILAGMKDDSAQIKYDQAGKHFNRLKALNTKNADFVMGGKQINHGERKLWGKWKSK